MWEIIVRAELDAPSRVRDTCLTDALDRLRDAILAEDVTGRECADAMEWARGVVIEDDNVPVSATFGDLTLTITHHT